VNVMLMPLASPNSVKTCWKLRQHQLRRNHPR
jgi:hypothetical protein